MDNNETNPDPNPKPDPRPIKGNKSSDSIDMKQLQSKQIYLTNSSHKKA